MLGQAFSLCHPYITGKTPVLPFIHPHDS